MEKEEAFDLLIRMVASADRAQQLPVDITRLDKIIHEELPQALEKTAPPNFPELRFDFEHVYEQFREFLLFDKLIGRNIVALGGGFSSGKSSFLNSLLGRSILPAKLDPSTAVPTYVIHEAQDTASAINEFDVKLPLAFDDIKQIAHGFGPEGEEITLGHLLKSVFVTTPDLPYQHIAFLDTPGYSKPDSDAYSARTDERIAHAQLNSSNFILWFIPADAGMITSDDLAFLSRLDKTIPKLFIITKADKAPSETELVQMKEKVRSVLDIKGISYVDVLAFSRRKGADYDRAAIEAHLAQLDTGEQEVDFARSFKELFVACNDYYDAELHEETVALSHLNKALTLGGDVPEVADYLTELTTAGRKHIETLREAQECLKKLQQEFFTETKFVSDKVGIRMPEPSEIDLIRDDITDAAAIVKGMLKQRNLPTDALMLGMLTRAMEDIAPKARECAGGSEHKRVLYELLKENLG